MSKLVVIVGITGNQGISVATTFLQNPTYRIRGLTRDRNSPAAQALTAQGIEMFQADLHDPETLVAAFKDANLIFSVIDFWKPFFDPTNIADAEKQGIPLGKYCYDLEYAQGKNICDAAADPSILPHLDSPGLIASTLSSARTCSEGKYQHLYHYDAKADVFPGYVQSTHPDLAAKISYIQTGFFMSSWNYMPHLWPGKQPDGTFLTRMATEPDAVQPHLDVRADLGSYVAALAQMKPGQMCMAAGEWCTWPEWVRKWGEVMGAEAGYEHISAEKAAGMMGGRFGEEVAEMYAYASWPGYDGGVKILRGTDLRGMGFDIQMTSVEDYTKKTDWSTALEIC